MEPNVTLDQSLGEAKTTRKTIRNRRRLSPQGVVAAPHRAAGLAEDDFRMELMGFEDQELTRLLAVEDTAHGISDSDALPTVPCACDRTRRSVISENCTPPVALDDLMQAKHEMHQNAPA